MVFFVVFTFYPLALLFPLFRGCDDCLRELKRGFGADVTTLKIGMIFAFFLAILTDAITI